MQSASNCQAIEAQPWRPSVSRSFRFLPFELNRISILIPFGIQLFAIQSLLYTLASILIHSLWFVLFTHSTLKALKTGMMILITMGGEQSSLKSALIVGEFFGASPLKRNFYY